MTCLSSNPYSGNALATKTVKEFASYNISVGTDGIISKKIELKESTDFYVRSSVRFIDEISYGNFSNFLDSMKNLSENFFNDKYTDKAKKIMELYVEIENLTLEISNKKHTISDVDTSKVSVTGNFTKDLKSGDVIFPVDFRSKTRSSSRDYFKPVYYKIKKVNPVNIVIDINQFKDIFSFETYYGASYVSNIFKDKDITAHIGGSKEKYEVIDDLVVERSFFENLIDSGSNGVMETMVVYKTNKNARRMKKFDKHSVIYKEWLIIPKEEWPHFESGNMLKFLEGWENKKLSQFSARWLAHHFVVNNEFDNLFKLTDKNKEHFSLSNIYFEKLFANNRFDIIKKFVPSDGSVPEFIKNIIVNSKSAKTIKGAIDNGIKLLDEEHVIYLLKSGATDAAAVLINNGAVLQKNVALEIYNDNRIDTATKRFIQINYLM